jgi:hypothetical protein
MKSPRCKYRSGDCTRGCSICPGAPVRFAIFSEVASSDCLEQIDGAVRASLTLAVVGFAFSTFSRSRRGEGFDSCIDYVHDCGARWLWAGPAHRYPGLRRISANLRRPVDFRRADFSQPSRCGLSDFAIQGRKVRPGGTRR